MADTMNVNPWFETLGVCFLAMLGVVLGSGFSRLPRPYWTIGYFIPLLFLGLFLQVRRNPELEFLPPISWLFAGRTEFALGALLTTMILTTPLSRLTTRRVKVLVCLLMGVVIMQTGILPFLAPALNRSYLRSLKTRIDEDGVCLQSNDYNCGPAAAVTALRQLGLPAEEGEIAILAHSSRFTGTEADVLQEALQRRYATNGLLCEYRYFRSIDELRGAGIVVARIKFGLLLDHYVAVLEVREKEIVVGDPDQGKRTLSFDDFEAQWRHSGVVLKRKF